MRRGFVQSAYYVVCISGNQSYINTHTQTCSRSTCKRRSGTLFPNGVCVYWAATAVIAAAAAAVINEEPQDRERERERQSGEHKWIYNTITQLGGRSILVLCTICECIFVSTISSIWTMQFTVHKVRANVSNLIRLHSIQFKSSHVCMCVWAYYCNNAKNVTCRVHVDSVWRFSMWINWIDNSVIENTWFWNSCSQLDLVE